MKPITTEWIAKAEGDYHTMLRECQAENFPNYDAVCFHAQQCAEKYLKAMLCEAGVRFGKIHDLTALLDIVREDKPELEAFREDLAYLSEFAVSSRYPGDAADQDCAIDAKQRCERFRQAAKTAIQP